MAATVEEIRQDLNSRVQQATGPQPRSEKGEERALVTSPSPEFSQGEEQKIKKDLVVDLELEEPSKDLRPHPDAMGQEKKENLKQTAAQAALKQSEAEAESRPKEELGRQVLKPPQSPKQLVAPIPEKVMLLVYKHAKDAILKGISIGSKAFKNYLKNRIEQKNVPDEIIDIAIDSADYSQLTDRYIKNGEVIAQESEKYTLTRHAKERIAEPDLKTVTPLFKKYSEQAKRAGIKGEKNLLKYLQEKIQPRNIPQKTVDDVIDTGKCKKLTGRRLKYIKNDITVIVSERDHSIITVYKRTPLGP